ncbi:MAG: restriction endonuclease subunit S, partial [Solirubrobacterales bacterium]
RPIPIGSTCFVCIGSTIGKVGITSFPVCATNQQINAVVPADQFHERYVFHLLTRWSDHIKGHASPSPVPILSKGAFERLEIFTSVDKGEQSEIAEILDLIDQKIVNHRNRVVLLEQLFTELLHRLVRGRIRVNELDLSGLAAGAPAAAEAAGAPA